ncbi:DNA-binding transcriptional MerR regulator [Actinoplanes octamycinicus]|uniref:DNA-binding transcriptional MerR regulator n=1 Tax=Actinoplanes octamycinicus TaxID=135948 RepID=A0A7W7M863_9ACTN|nr:MerR family transcriptional regulator [Actinoplanes octamycinicus]MBB4740535.1 DNA-binding transcriptional MerR regulator [Actinoplanes octamycinicus]GIE59794.1 hypothetical protein Aoc01nite_51960 [Actinoplanes octamycinicus]
MTHISIGAFGAATGLSIAALRHYDEVGLLKPADVDPSTGYRRYAPAQVDQARLICGLRALDLPIDQIRAVLGRPADIKEALDTHRERLVDQIRELTQRVRAVDEFLERGSSVPAFQDVRPVQISIRVRDIEAAAAFYARAFDAVHQPEIASLRFGSYRSDRFFLITLVEGGSGSARLGLLVDAVDRAHAQALAAGAEEISPPTDYAWKPRTSAVRDPDGNLIELYQGWGPADAVAA